jgi:hypothetical protein
MLSAVYADSQIKATYFECRYAECQYVKCHYADCRGAIESYLPGF